MIIGGSLSYCKKTGFINWASASPVITQNAVIDPSLPNQSELIYQADVPVDDIYILTGTVITGAS